MYVASLVFVFVVVVNSVCLFVCLFFLAFVYFEFNCACYSILSLGLFPLISVDFVYNNPAFSCIAAIKNSNHLPFAPKVFATSKAITPIQQNEDSKK